MCLKILEKPGRKCQQIYRYMSRAFNQSTIQVKQTECTSIACDNCRAYVAASLPVAEFDERPQQPATPPHF